MTTESASRSVSRRRWRPERRDPVAPSDTRAGGILLHRPERQIVHGVNDRPREVAPACVAIWAGAAMIHHRRSRGSTRIRGGANTMIGGGIFQLAGACEADCGGAALIDGNTREVIVIARLAD